MIIGKTIDELNIGDKATFAKTITETDVYNFAGVTGDMNPVHVNQPYTETTAFKSRIAHGILSSSLVANVLGTKLPGPGTLYKRQELKFIKPVYINDTIEASVEIIELEKDQNIVKVKTKCINQNGEMVVKGFAWVLPPTKKERDRAHGI